MSQTASNLLLFHMYITLNFWTFILFYILNKTCKNLQYYCVKKIQPTTEVTDCEPNPDSWTWSVLSVFFALCLLIWIWGWKMVVKLKIQCKMTCKHKCKHTVSHTTEWYTKNNKGDVDMCSRLSVNNVHSRPYLSKLSISGYRVEQF